MTCRRHTLAYEMQQLLLWYTYKDAALHIRHTLAYEMQQKQQRHICKNGQINHLHRPCTSLPSHPGGCIHCLLEIQAQHSLGGLLHPAILILLGPAAHHHLLHLHVKGIHPAAGKKVLPGPRYVLHLQQRWMRQQAPLCNEPVKQLLLLGIHGDLGLLGSAHHPAEKISFIIL